MAQRIEVFAVPVTAGTAKSSAVETDLSFVDGTVVGIEIIIPDGHCGLTGIALMQAHSQVIPKTLDTFITGNNEPIKWPVEGFLNNGSWSALCYNTDVYDHTFHLRFLVNENTLTGPGTLGFSQPPLVIGPPPPVQ